MAVLVYAESFEGVFKKSAFEIISYAKSCADLLNTELIAVAIGNNNDADLANLGKFGASKVINHKSEVNTPEAFAQIISTEAQTNNATLICISNTYGGKSLAARVAALCQAAIVSGAIALPQVSGSFKVRKSVFSGKAFADVELNTPVKVIALTPNSVSINEGSNQASIEHKNSNISADLNKTQVIEVNRITGKIPLTEAELVVSAGRGMKGPENWGMIEELANSLGAATACSKPVSDMHWRPHEEHVGQTGITIKPNLYIAIGISGAIQHLAGVSSSKVIVAVNKDPEAPFFKAADYGIVGDAFEVVPKLIEAAKAYKSSQ